MQNKYLPIGTVCTLKNGNRKIMIISYFSLEYNGNVKMYDYKGCVYPEGLLLPAQTVSFNHEDIATINFFGYQDVSYQIFNNTLILTQTGALDQRMLQPGENGTAISNGYRDKAKFLDASSEPVPTANPFIVPTSTDDALQETLTQIPNDIFQFDENGVVVFDEYQDKAELLDTPSEPAPMEKPVVAPANPVPQEAAIKIPSSIFTFDENGVVTSDGSVPVEPPKEDSKETKYSFDELGFVISENK